MKQSIFEEFISFTGIKKLLVDVDGVILNSRKALAEFAERQGYALNINPAAARGWQFLGLPKEEYEKVLHHPDQIAQEKPFINGVHESFAMLLKEGFEINLLTSIDESMIKKREEYLRKAKLPFGEMMTVPRAASKKEVICANAPAILIDDYPHHAREAIEFGCEGVIFHQPYNKEEKGFRLRGWNEFDLSYMFKNVMFEMVINEKKHFLPFRDQAKLKTKPVAAFDK